LAKLNELQLFENQKLITAIIRTNPKSENKTYKQKSRRKINSVTLIMV